MVKLHPHARERLFERGVSETEVAETVEEGESFPAKYGRMGFRRNFSFNGVWREKYFATKQIEVYAVKDGDDWVVITIIARYF